MRAAPPRARSTPRQLAISAYLLPSATLRLRCLATPPALILSALVGERRFGITVRIHHEPRVLVADRLVVLVEHPKRNLEPVRRRGILRHRRLHDVEAVLVHVNGGVG